MTTLQLKYARWVSRFRRRAANHVAALPPRRFIDCMELEERSLMSATPLAVEAIVNTTTTDSQVTTPEAPPAVAADAAGNSVVVWSSQNQDGSGWGVYAKRFNASGVAQGSEQQINQTTANDQQYATVAMDANGNFVVTWTEHDATATSGEVKARRYDSTGTALGNEFTVNSTTADAQGYSSVAMDAAGNFFITWSSNNQDGSGWGVYGQRYSSAGVAQGSEFLVNTAATGNQMFSRAAMDADGDFVVTWDSEGQDGSGWGVYGQRYNAAGTSQGSEFLINTATSFDQKFSSVDMDGAGNFVVTWSETGDGIGYGILAQRYLANGTAAGGAVNVNTTTAGQQLYSTVAMNGNGDYLVTWSSEDQDAAGGWGVYAQRYTSTGAAIDGEFRVNSTTAGSQQYSSAVLSNDGIAAFAWSGEGTGDTQGIFSRRFSFLAIDVTPTSGTTSEIGNTATFTIALSWAPTADVTINLASTDTTEGTLSTSSLTFTSVNWNTPQMVTVTGVNDNLSDDSIAYSVTTSAATSADSRYNGMNAADVTLTNIDEDALGEETRVNTNTAGTVLTLSGGVAPETSAQSIAMDAGGNYVVVWSADLGDGNAFDVYGQLFTSAGMARGSEFLINTSTGFRTQSQQYPTVAMDNAGNFVVTWSSNAQDSNGYGVYGQRYNATGVKQGSEFLINTTILNNQRNSSIAMSANGAFVVTWRSQNGDGSNDGIFAQRYDAAGVVQGGQFLVNTTTTSFQVQPFIAMDDAGNFVIGWQSNLQDGSGYGVYAKRFNASGVAQGGRVSGQHLYDQ